MIFHCKWSKIKFMCPCGLTTICPLAFAKSDRPAWICYKWLFSSCPSEAAALFFFYIACSAVLFILLVAAVAVAAVTWWGLRRYPGSDGRALTLNAGGPRGWTLTLKVSSSVGQDKLFCYWTTKNKNLWPWLAADDAVKKRGDERECAFDREMEKQEVRADEGRLLD